MGIVSGLEWISTDLIEDSGIELKGWSGSVMTSLDDYDGVFEELYDLYGDKVKVHPVVKLVYMVGASAAVYHLTNTMAKHQKSLEEDAAGANLGGKDGAEYLRDLNRKYMEEERAQQARAHAHAQARAQPAPRQEASDIPLPPSVKDMGTVIPMKPPPVEVPERETRMRGPAAMMTMPRPVGLQSRVAPSEIGSGAPAPDAEPLRLDVSLAAGHPSLQGAALAGIAESESGDDPPKKRAGARGRRKKDDEGVTL